MAEITFNDIIKPENRTYKRSKLMTDNVMHYCRAVDTALHTMCWPKCWRRKASRKEPWESLPSAARC
jgi:hypothetical protein